MPWDTRLSPGEAEARQTQHIGAVPRRVPQAVPFPATHRPLLHEAALAQPSVMECGGAQ